MAGEGNATAENSGKRKRDIYPGDYLFNSSSDDEDSKNGGTKIKMIHKHDFGPNLKAKGEPNPRSIPQFSEKENRDEEHDKDKQPCTNSDFNHGSDIVRIMYGGVSVGTWARVKRGEYMGDLAQVVHVNELKRKATVKLLPRLDLQTVANKISGVITGKQYASPDPRLITSSELDGYRVRVRRSLDRDTGDLYEVFEVMKLKDGYVFKKLALNSLIFCFSDSKPPSEAELREFMPDKNEESNDVNKNQTMNNDNVGDGFLSSDMENGFEIPDLVTHGSEKDELNKVLGKGTEEPVEGSLLKKAVFDKKSNALDHHKKIISMNDTVRVLKGPLEGGKSDASGLGGESGCSEPEPPPEATPAAAAGYEGLHEASFVEKLRSGAQELGGLVEEAATRCLGKVSLEDQLRGARMELELYKERVSAVEAERDTFCNSLKEERERVSVVEAERDTFWYSLKKEMERVSAVEAERDTFYNSLKEERGNIVSVLSRLLDTEVQLVTRLKEDLRVWCARYEAAV